MQSENLSIQEISLDGLNALPRDIVDFAESDPISFVQYIAETTQHRLSGYKLTYPALTVSNKSCKCCGNPTLVSMVYKKYKWEHDYDLCLTCFNAFKLTPIYGAEGDE